MATMRYFVSDVGEAISFYADRLGFEVVERYDPAMAIVRLGDLELWLAGPVSSAARPMPDGRSPEPGGWNRVVIKVDDLDANIAQLGAAGAVFRNEIVRGPGGKQILVEDPSGNVIELFEPGS
jgi:catechol 2,3-dioxygenase-like lactoylglutathione lyase family enzyme